MSLYEPWQVKGKMLNPRFDGLLYVAEYSLTFDDYIYLFLN